jgi:hypothetical protein
MIAAKRSADMGGPDSGRRVRALGTRDRVLSYLAGGEISDPKGMASTVLAAAIGYPGSSAAFAQLLSGMERAGLIEREIRGKRTYRIAAAGVAQGLAGTVGQGSATGAAQGSATGAAHGSAGEAAQVSAGAALGPGAAGLGDRGVSAGRSGRDEIVGGAAGFDYDELARRLLVQVVRRLAVAPGHPPPGVTQQPADSDDTGLGQTVASLEQKLASVQSRQRRLTAENAKLRAQLQAAQESLAQAEERAGAAQITGQLGGPELQLLERLLSAPRDQADLQADRPEEAGGLGAG